jgi:hypothetical protein
MVGAGPHATDGTFATTKQPTWSGAVPRGVPQMTGIVFNDFNRVLLRHGYHWKDPGAGITHGEYTHRLQWYAIIRATPPLGLSNSFLNIFKSFGSLWSKQAPPVRDKTETLPLPDNAGYYLWEVIFDCFTESSKEPYWRPKASTYNCPDVLTDELCKLPEKDDDPLFTLKVLMHVRRWKRQKLDNFQPVTRFEGKSAKTATQVVHQEGNFAYIVWYLS